MRVLISRPDKLGDLILALHAVKQLKAMHPEYEIYLHVSEYTLPFAELVKFVDGCVTFGDDLAPYKFDAVVDLMAKPWTAKEYIGIPIRAGNAARWFSPLYNRKAWVRRSKAAVNEAEYNWELISCLSHDLTLTPLKTSLDLSDLNGYDEDSDLGKDAVVLMYSKTTSAVPWPIENWKELIKEAAEKLNKEVILLLGPAEKNYEAEFSAFCKTLPKELKARVILNTDFEKLITLLSNAACYVGTSTGVTHLASALGLGGVAMYPIKRSMLPQRWEPFQTKMQIVSLARSPTPSQIAALLSGEKIPEIDAMRRSEISAFIVCCNEEKKIRRALESVKWCDEIVVVDSGSKDATVSICKEYTDKVIHNPWPGFSAQKQFALERCSKKWILNIDSDEEVSPLLRGEIIKILMDDNTGLEVQHGYNINRVVYFLNRWWNKGGWYPEYRLRLMQKEFAKWGGIDPHEKALVTGNIGKISAHLNHFTYDNFFSQVDALNKHAEVAARALKNEGRRFRLHNLIFNPIFRFIKFYILKLGIREGLPGFIVACHEMFYTFLKYSKLWELGKKDSKKQQ